MTKVMGCGVRATHAFASRDFRHGRRARWHPRCTVFALVDSWNSPTHADDAVPLASFAPAPISLNVSRYEALLRRNRLVAALGPEVLREMARAATLKRFHKGEAIWHAGAPATHFQVVVSGLVKLVAPNPGMRQTIIDVFGPCEAVGYWVAIDGSPYIGDAMPVTPRVDTLLVPAAVLTHAMKTRPDAALAITNGLLAHTRTLRAKIAVMCAGSVEHRLAMLLLDLQARFGDEAADGTVVVPVPLSRGDLALCVGATVETVIRMMSRWQKRGVLETHAHGFVLRDVVTLERLVEGFRTTAVYDGQARACCTS